MALNSGLLGAFNFNTGATLSATSGAAPAFTTTGTPVNFGTAKISQGWAFGGYQSSGTGSRLLKTDDTYTFRLNSGDADLGVSKTIAFWAYATTWNSQPGIVSNWANAGGPVQWLFYADDSTHLTFQIRNKVGVDTTARISAPSTSAWHFYVLTYDSSTGVFGVSVDNGSFTTNTVTSVAHGAGSIEVGNRNAGAADINGAIDCFAIWNRVLDSTDITNLYNSGTGREAPYATTPVANFTGSYVYITVGDTVNFTDTSTNTPTSWSWSFGSGEGTSTSQNPSHQYNTAGTFDVSLDATNAAGTDNETKTSFITVNAAATPDIESSILAAYPFTSGSLADYFATGPTLTNEGTAVSFTPAKITDGFAFGGYQSSGAASYLKTTNTIFSLRDSAGQPTKGRTRFFTMWVYPNSYAGGDATILATHQSVPQFLFYVFANTNLVTAVYDASNALHFITMTKPSTGSWHFLTVFWDAENLHYGMSIDNGTPVIGTNSLTMKVSTDYFSVGTSSTATKPWNGAIDCITVHDRMLSAAEITYLYNAGSGKQPPFGAQADFSGTPVSLIKGASVAFTDTSTDTPTYWAWTFGSGEGTSTSQNPSHQYDTAGDFTVGLTASNNGGNDIETKTNYIHVEEPVVTDFSVDDTTPFEQVLVTFTDTSTGSPESWSWDFGDGGTSTLQNPTHTYTVPGTYTVVLIAAKTGPSSSDTETKTNYITVAEIVRANFTGTPTTVIQGEEVDFTDTSTGSPTAWDWDFGDSGSSAVQNPSHQYDDLGTFTVIMEASKSGSTDTKTRTNYITVNPPLPVAEFSADAVIHLAPFEVNFTDESTGVVDSWLWDFGDGDTSTEQNPTHTYEDVGVYTVTLTVTNVTGSDDEEKIDYIEAKEVTVVEKTIDPDTGDYESLADLAADAQDLVAAFEAWEVTCDTFEDTDNVPNFDGWVTSEGSYLLIKPSDPHDSKGEVTEMSYAFTGSLNLGNIPFIWLQGLQLAGLTMDDSTTLWAEECLFADEVIVEVGGECFLWNCILIGDFTNDGAVVAKLYNDTIIGTVDMGNNADSEIFNCYALAYTGLTGVLLTTSASANTSGSEGLQEILHDDEVTFVSAIDLRPTEDSPLVDAATSRDGQDPPLDFSIDFNGRERPDPDADLEDIGAMEFAFDIGEWPESVWLLERAAATSTTDFVNSVLVDADSSEAAVELMQARRPGEGWTASLLTQGTLASASWWGWTFKVSWEFEGERFSFSHVGTEGSTIADVIIALSGLIDGSTYNTGQRKLVVVPSGMGEVGLHVEVIPPGFTRSLDVVIQRIDDERDPDDALAVVFADIVRIPYIVKELK